MFSIIQAPNEILRTPAKPVNFYGAKLEKIITKMKQTLLAQNDPEGVGLAANQVGLPISCFLARFSTRKDEPVRVFINPEIIAHSENFQPANKEEEEKTQLEGCLSLPKYYGIVKRYAWVRIKYYVLSIKGTLKESEEKFGGFAATVIQHEMDHLDGKIFVERILEQNGKLYKSIGKNKKRKDTWEEVEL